MAGKGSRFQEKGYTDSKPLGCKNKKKNHFFDLLNIKQDVDDTVEKIIYSEE